MDERKQPLALIVIVILGALACYVLGLGPACWLSSRFGGERIVTVIYRPVTFAAEVSGSERLMNAIQSYSRLGASNLHEWTLSPDAAGHAEWRPPFYWDLEVNRGGASMWLASEELPKSPSSP